MAVKLVHQTEDQFLARFRARYREANGDEAVRLAAWLTAHQGDFTAAQLRAAFGLKAAELTAMLGRAKALSDAKAVLKGARGE